jgi:enamine deaminase RidA (YjgF/YER057c/UK114 family)
MTATPSTIARIVEAGDASAGASSATCTTARSSGSSLVVEVADDGVGGADPSPASTIYGGGQNGIGSDGTIVEGSLGAQSEQAFENLRTVLAESGASPEDVARRWLAPAQRVAGRRRFGRVP